MRELQKSKKMTLYVVVLVLSSTCILPYSCLLSSGAIVEVSENNNEFNHIDFNKNFGYITGVISQITSNQQILADYYQDSEMFDFHGIDDCHSTALGEDQVIMIIDTPVDYRHEIFTKEGKDSLKREDCYRIEINFNNQFQAGNVENVSYTESTFTDEDFNFHPDYFSENALYHGTHVAGIVKQIAPKSKIISMGIEADNGPGIVTGAVKALVWAKEQIENGKQIDIIT